ncbi:hypothetical protein AcW1_001881 [Taiwanofungus camphoratus]|nr:hypothetical protein AcW1_001881 [Antrodia cinnamomea]
MLDAHRIIANVTSLQRPNLFSSSSVLIVSRITRNSPSMDLSATLGGLIMELTLFLLAARFTFLSLLAAFLTACTGV